MTAHGWSLRCTGCGRAVAPGLPDYCEACGGPVEALLESLPPSAGIFDGRVTDSWKYVSLYPVAASPPFSLGEGGTPLVGSTPAIARFESVRFKLDHLNPSGSFKDRSVSVGVAWAVEDGAPGVVCASSGNAAGSVATYAARAGLPAVIIAPAETPEPKLASIEAHGARLLCVSGHFSRSFALAREVARLLSWVNLTTTFVNPWACEGLKSVAYELFEQLGKVPEWISVPVGAGPLLRGTFKGYLELQELGLIERVPRMLAVQPSGCAPVVRAFERDEEVVTGWEEVTTSVSGINDPLQGYESDGTLTLRCVRDSDGAACAVTDNEIDAAGRLLATAEGIYVEDAAAASLAGVMRLRSSGFIEDGESVVCLLTGHGLKRVEHEHRSGKRTVVRNADEALQSVGELAAADRVGYAS